MRRELRPISTCSRRSVCQRRVPHSPCTSVSLLATYYKPLISSLLQMRSFGKSKAITSTGLQRKLIRSQVSGCFRPYTGPCAVLRTKGAVRRLTEGGKRDPGQTDLPGAERAFYPPSLVWKEIHRTGRERWSHLLGPATQLINLRQKVLLSLILLILKTMGEKFQIHF